jgi:hypothetical protein
MSNTGIQSPLGVNAVSTLLQNQGFYINPTVASITGSSTDNKTYNPGSIVNDTYLFWVTYAINIAYQNLGVEMADATYNNLISIGSQSIPALGNAIPPTYMMNDPSGQWAGQGTTGYAIQGLADQAQNAPWLPYTTDNVNIGITQWGYFRLIALQAWNEFNWNGSTAIGVANAGSFVIGTVYTILSVGTTDFTTIGATSNTPGIIFTATGIGAGSGTASYVYAVNQFPPAYKDFTSSFLTCNNFNNYSNSAIHTVNNSKTFQQGTFSNQNDLINGDVTGVSLALQDFGQDLINLGKALNIAQINKFGLPSTLLQLIKQNNAQSQNLNLALLSSGLSVSEVAAISNGSVTPTKDQEQKLYSAFLIIKSAALTEILTPLSCKTKGLTSLADLLNVKKLFPLSYSSLTVPIYNTTPGPTNSKTYYLLYSQGQVNSQLTAPAVAAQVAPVTPPAFPPVATPVSAPVTPAKIIGASSTAIFKAGGLL